MDKKYTIAIVGAGGIGKAVGLLIADSDALRTDIYIGDVNFEAAKKAATWIQEGIAIDTDIIPFAMPYEGVDDEMNRVFANCDLVLDCLPGSQAPRIARLAKAHEMHYANLTEYVKETDEITALAKDASTGFVLQTGLAPGFINVLANYLFQHFCQEFGVTTVDKIEMKVGALTQHACAPHFYGFTWSPIGVATEYIEDAVAVRNGEKVLLPALSERETIIIDTVTYENDLTSGGAADLPDAFAGKVKSLDYKTIRYPGHYEWVAGIVKQIENPKDKIAQLQATMLATIPALEDDVVIIYASVQGKDQNGVLRAKEKTYRIEPKVIGGKKLRAIQTTTAAPLAESARLLLTGKWKGVVFQSQIDPESFMKGPFVSSIYGAIK
ncbi:MAG: saccharopine dehydrogenase family protein [Saprospiraceae bacterium]